MGLVLNLLYDVYGRSLLKIYSISKITLDNLAREKKLNYYASLSSTKTLFLRFTETLFLGSCGVL